MFSNLTSRLLTGCPISAEMSIYVFVPANISKLMHNLYPVYIQRYSDEVVSSPIVFFIFYVI